ncbi:hypothetical protein B0F90DRAFT_1807900 [Multifurca ochricompacta]|uniref:HIT-type domain-containing protein n=1 Tax=Multifurca ochricompacta TaxID=376703 RepID=A0AAD4MBZ1_9AGAM|nr:hypothetical protein B0F90DRAFT_1807900 [Multifurca ochricompacta]
MIPSPHCAVCSSCVPIYTCPRCTIRTCSLPCSTAHKMHTSCSGMRDKTKYIPMNQYTHGAMTDDYVFLEDVSRRVNSWGQDIARSGYSTLQGVRGRGERGRRNPRDSVSGKKRDILRSQLELRDIEVDLLPAGMERRMLNQSTWDPKIRTAFLTIEYKIHPPPTFLDVGLNNAQEPYTLITHRNNFDLSLRDLFQSQISKRTKGKSNLPTWVIILALPHPDIPDTFTPPQFFVRAPWDLSEKSGNSGYITLDGERKLSALLRNRQFVEFPTIEVWEEGARRDILFDQPGAFGLQGEQRPVKRRKLDISKGRAAIAGLLGGYGSEEDEEDDTALTRLGEYEESDAENEQATTSGEGDTDGLSQDDDDDEGESVAMVDSKTSLAVVQEAQRRHEEDGDDKVDWEVSDDDN